MAATTWQKKAEAVEWLRRTNTLLRDLQKKRYSEIVPQVNTRELSYTNDHPPELYSEQGIVN